jgi:hypothetical protein
MPRIQHVVERSSSPSNEDDDLRIEHSEELSKAPQRHPLDPAAFEERDFILAARRTSRHVLLTQAEPLAKDARDTSDPEIVHGTTMAGGA